MRIPEKPLIRSKLQLSEDQQKKLHKISPLFDIIIDKKDGIISLEVYDNNKVVEKVSVAEDQSESLYLRAFAEVCERALDYVKFHIAKSPAEQLFCLSDAQIQKIAVSFQKDKRSN